MPCNPTKTAAFTFLLGALAMFDANTAGAVNSEHPMNTDHSRASTTASDPQDPVAPIHLSSGSAETGSKSHELNGTTSAAESADTAIPGHAHRGFRSSAPSDDAAKTSPAPNPSEDKRGADMDGTDHTMNSAVGSDGMQTR